MSCTNKCTQHLLRAYVPVCAGTFRHAPRNSAMLGWCSLLIVICHHVMASLHGRVCGTPRLGLTASCSRSSMSWSSMIPAACVWRFTATGGQECGHLEVELLHSHLSASPDAPSHHPRPSGANLFQELNVRRLQTTAFGQRKGCGSTNNATGRTSRVALQCNFSPLWYNQWTVSAVLVLEYSSRQDRC